MISVREALDRVLRQTPRSGGEQVSLTEAHGRTLHDDVIARRDVPPFRNSAMDGYAVRGADLTSRDDGEPVRLRILETVAAGGIPSLPVAEGTATRIMTGAVVPDGADTVVRVEDTREIGETVEITMPPKPGANVRQAGEDVRAGDEVLRRGRVLRPADIGLLASIGLATVEVARRPRVAIISTGDELVDIGQPLGPGQIVNSNAYILAAAVEEAGATATIFGIVRDRPELIRAAFAEACRADVVLSTGGVSVGSFDYVRQILADLGYEEQFWKVAQKPGKPLTFGRRRDALIFGLPGNPVSSLVCFYLYVLPALRTMMGSERVFLPTAMATMAESLTKANGLTEFVRCSFSGEPEDYQVRSTGTQSSGVLRSLSLGDGLIIGPADTPVLERGRRVRVVILHGTAVGDVRPF
jgi:molybdopterin molybdotransferase